MMIIEDYYNAQGYLTAFFERPSPAKSAVAKARSSCIFISRPHFAWLMVDAVSLHHAVGLMFKVKVLKSTS
jgi:hypothetical protein